MKRNIYFFFYAFLIMALLSGCTGPANMVRGYKIEGTSVSRFEDLNDDQALKVIVSIYNIQPEAYELQIARGLTLQRSMEILASRKSEYIDNSGIFDLVYEKTDLKKLSDTDLITIFDELKELTLNNYYSRDIESLSTRENAKRIIHLTGLKLIAEELRSRENTRQAWDFASQALAVAINAALSAL